ncbi:hypothetical protein [Tardiphaga robiniae]|nr:hypothetical protein [Tardiphaga robiniae]
MAVVGNPEHRKSAMTLVLTMKLEEALKADDEAGQRAIYTNSEAE